jgi:hypothetical protein
MTKLLTGLLLAAAAASAAAADSHPSLYSFSDIYRLTVTGEVMETFTSTQALAEPRLRAASLQAEPPGAAAEPRFIVSPLPAEQRWLLIIAGLAAAGWVAHRRLANGY